MNFILQLWHTVWWSYARDAGLPMSIYYRCFNILEGILWWCIAGFVLFRWWRNQKSWLQLGYFSSFITFGWTDFREAVALETWLILVKGINLGLILYLRFLILKHIYPESKYKL